MLTISVISSDPSKQRWQCPINNGDYGSSEPWISEINGFQARYLGPDSTGTPQKNVRPPLDKILDFCPTTMKEIVRILNLENRRYLQHELSNKGLEVR